MAALKRAEAEGGGEAAWCDVFGVFLPCMIVLPLHRRVGVSALSSSEFMNPHVVVAAGRARDGVPTLSGIKRRAKEVIIHFVLQPDDEAGLASCGNLHFAGGYEEGGQECDNT